MNKKLDPNLNTESQNWHEILREKVKNKNSFNNSQRRHQFNFKSFLKEITNFKRKENKTRNFLKDLSTRDPCNIVGSTSTSIPFSKAEFDLIVVPITEDVGCGVAISTKLTCDFLTKAAVCYLEK